MQRFSPLFAAMIVVFMLDVIAGTNTSPAYQAAALFPAGQAARVHTDARPVTAPSSLAANACSFQTPTPVLQPNAYTGQTLVQQSQNQLTEAAQLHNGIRIEIRQSACVDFVTTEFVLVVPHDQDPQPDQDGWIELARTEIANLKTRGTAAKYFVLDDFLKRAHSLSPHDGIRSACRDGALTLPGECSWESLGGFIFSVTRTGQATRISVTEYVSG